MTSASATPFPRAATRELLVEAARQGDLPLVVDTVTGTRVDTRADLFLSVLLGLDETGRSLDALLDALVRRSSRDTALTLLLGASDGRVTGPRPHVALRCAVRAEAIARGVGQGRDDGRWLVRALVNKGVALGRASEDNEALACLEEAVAVAEKAVKAETSEERARDLGHALTHKGNALLCLGRSEEALGCYEAARKVLDSFEASRTREGLDALVDLMSAKGVALANLMKFEDASRCLDAVIALQRRLLETDQSPEARAGLAVALNNKANLLRVLGKPLASLGCYDEVLDISLRLAESRTPSVGLGAAALFNKAETLLGLGRLDEAERCYNGSIAGYQVLLAEGEEVASQLASAQAGKGQLLNALDRPLEALTCHEQAIQWRKMSTGAGGNALRLRLLTDIRLRMNTLVILRRWRDAAADVNHILTELSALADEDASRLPVLVREGQALVAILRGLPKEGLASLYTAVGDAADVVRELVESEGGDT